MTAPIPPTFEPLTITLGESLAWTKSLAEYPASEWTLAYYFRGTAEGFDVIATADGQDFAIAVDSDTTAELTAGVTYYWQAWVSDGAGQNVKVAEGQTKAVAGFSTTEPTATSDNRSANKIALDNINALLSGKATLDQQSYQIANGGSMRQLARIPIPELLQLKKHFLAQVRRENRRGRSPFRTIAIKFEDAR